jgi:hypothetical protein
MEQDGSDVRGPQVVPNEIPLARGAEKVTAGEDESDETETGNERKRHE